MKRNAICLWTALLCLLACGSLNLAPAALAAEEGTGPGVEVHRLLDQAKKSGAKGQLPHAWWDLNNRLKEADKQGATDEQWADMTTEAQRLVSAAAFVDEMRKQKSGMEALLGRFDQALREIAALSGEELDPTLSGTPAAKDLIERLNQENFRRQVMVDSLTVENRRFSESLGGRSASQESLITALEVEVSALRRQLWETELRVGVAEADRSAAESVLTKKQQREAAITLIRSSFSADEGEILLTPEGAVMMRLYGMSFAVGSANLKSGQGALVDKVAQAVAMFPAAQTSIEGHTDDTGSRDANLRLSRRRAETVARLLEQKLAVAEGTFETVGFGPDKPLALNDTTEGRALNRRIDVIIRPAGL